MKKWRFEYGLSTRNEGRFQLSSWDKPEKTTRAILKKLRKQFPSREWKSRTQIVQGQKIKFIESRSKR